MTKVAIPKKLEPIVRAFFVDSPETAKALIIQAIKAIYGSDEDRDLVSDFRKAKHQTTPEEVEGICSLMQGIKPTDMLEALFAAQIVASHMLGMRKLATGHPEDLHVGLKMIRFSNDAICQLQKKRNGSMQNITVNYNYAGSSPTSTPMIIPLEEIERAN